MSSSARTIALQTFRSSERIRDLLQAEAESEAKDVVSFHATSGVAKPTWRKMSRSSNLSIPVRSKRFAPYSIR